ncbi:vomeronasal type-2 receptor 26-like [Crotalus tigris]|uniref:vomeronasal type-2 receptor 26-like n=1 Tax=Crotalus tigris TaxID=88082 RepID=UPI00192F3A8E|nr:vomeronasal type-2 receptor 26-like [Crotalus tigris]
MTYEAMIDSLSTGQENVPNYSCGRSKKLLAVVEGIDSELFTCISTMLGIYKIPQINYGIINQIAEQKHPFPFSYWMIPKQEPPHLATVKLLLHFQWTWIGLFAPDHEDGEKFRNSFVLAAIKKEICIAFSQNIPLQDKERKIGKFLHYAHSEVKVFVCHLDLQASLFLASVIPKFEYHSKGFGEKVWIVTALTDIGIRLFYQHVNLYHKHLLLSFSTVARKSAPYHHFKVDTFNIDKLVKTTFLPFYSRPVLSKKVWIRYTEKERWKFAHRETMFRILSEDAFGIYNALQALSRALTSAYSLQLNRRRMRLRNHLLFHRLQPWQFHRFLRDFQLHNISGKYVYMDENGIPVADFYIIDWAILHNGSPSAVKIGKIENVASSEIKFSINESAIIWPTSFKQKVPFSRCTSSCLPGYKKLK